MSDQVQPLKPSRRKWGWFLVAALVIELIVFSALIGADTNGIQQQRGLVQNFMASAKANRNVEESIREVQFSNMKISQYQAEIRMLYVVAAIVMAATLGGAVIGLRRRKDT
jgi:hypothetical protein